MVVLHGLGAYSASTRAPRPTKHSLLFGPALFGPALWPAHLPPRPPTSPAASSIAHQSACFLARSTTGQLARPTAREQPVSPTGQLARPAASRKPSHLLAQELTDQLRASLLASFASLPACLPACHLPTGLPHGSASSLVYHLPVASTFLSSVHLLARRLTDQLARALAGPRRCFLFSRALSLGSRSRANTARPVLLLCSALLAALKWLTLPAQPRRVGQTTQQPTGKLVHFDPRRPVAGSLLPRRVRHSRYRAPHYVHARALARAHARTKLTTTAPGPSCSGLGCSALTHGGARSTARPLLLSLPALRCVRAHLTLARPRPTVTRRAAAVRAAD